MRERTGMHVLITGDEPLREGDEELVCGLSWRRLAGFRLLRRPSNPVRRKLTGWEAVKYALKSEVLGNDREGREIVPWMWKCKCDKDSLHVYSEFPRCGKCGAKDRMQPNARKAEVILSIIEEK